MSTRHKMFASVLLTLILAGCGSSSDGSVVVTPPPPPPPPPPPTDFTLFVKDQFAATADNTDPVEIDDEDFAFPDNENPAAFDDLLQ